MKSIAVLALLAAALQTTCVAQQKFPLKVSITTPTPVVESGAEIGANVTVVNTSDQTVELLKAPDGHAEAANDVQVFDAEGTRLPRIHGPQTWLSLKKGSVEPGNSIDAALILNKLFDLSKPGRYTVVVRHKMIQPDDSDPKLKIIFVPSNSLVITVTQ